jgi:hypothetical protein
MIPCCINAWLRHSFCITDHAHTYAGHRLAPDYTPLSTLAMARLVAEMRAVYKAAAAEQAAVARGESKAIAEVRGAGRGGLSEVPDGVFTLRYMSPVLISETGCN